MLASYSCIGTNQFRIYGGLEELDLSYFKDLSFLSDGCALTGALSFVHTFITTAQFVRCPELSAPNFPGVPDEVIACMKYLEDNEEKSHLADIACVLVKCRIMEIDEGIRPSRLVDPRHVYCRALISGLRDPTFLVQELPTANVVQWIARNRTLFGQSTELDELLSKVQIMEREEEERQAAALRAFFERKADRSRETE
jgi:hypothetical protein